MPHIILEYAEGAIQSSQVKDILFTLHKAVADSGLFEASHIKTRAYAFASFTHAGGDEPYVHIQARIKSGRDADNKQRLSKEIITALKTIGLAVPVITVEIIDMDRDSYGKLAK